MRKASYNIRQEREGQAIFLEMQSMFRINIGPNAAS